MNVGLGPDATGVGWVYEYALVDRSGKHNLADLRALQDWTLKFELKTVPNVAEVASVGGMVRQYQIVPDPARMRALNITHEQIVNAVQAANRRAAAHCWRWAKRNLWCAPRAICASWRIFAR